MRMKKLRRLLRLNHWYNWMKRWTNCLWFLKSATTETLANRLPHSISPLSKITQTTMTTTTSQWRQAKNLAQSTNKQKFSANLSRSALSWWLFRRKTRDSKSSKKRSQGAGKRSTSSSSSSSAMKPRKCIQSLMQRSKKWSRKCLELSATSLT